MPGVSPSDALRAAVTLPVDRPTDLLPAFVLAAAAPAAARVPVYAAVAGALWLLARTGRLDPVVAELREVDWRAVGSGGEPGVPDGFDAGLADAVAGLVTPGVLAILGLGLLAAVVVYLLARSVAAAATQATTLSALRDRDDPLADGLDGVGRHWRRFLGLTLIRVVGFGLALAPLAAGVGALTVVGPAGALALGGGALLSLGLFVAVAVALTFAGPAVVVDDVGPVAAVRHSVQFVLGNVAAAAVYLVVAVGVSVGLGLLSGAAGVANVPRLVALATLLVAGPVLTAFSLALYAGLGLAMDERAERHRGTDPARRRLRRAFRGGLRSLGGFVRDHPGLHALSAAVLAAGVALGYRATAPYGFRAAPDRGLETFGAVPVGPFLNIAANNWLVAATGAFGGVFGGVPSVATVAFNGALVGAVAGVFDLAHFLALVAPHGVVELPAIAVAGALGLHLGVVAYRGARSRVAVEAVADELRRAWRVLLGLAVVVVVAAAIEAFLTPVVAEVLL